MFDPPSITAILHNDVPTLGHHAVVLLVTQNPAPSTLTLNTKPSTLNPEP